MHTRTTIARRLAAGLIAAVTVAGCGAQGGNPQAGGDIVEEQNTTSAAEEAATPSEAKFPVTAEYAGMTWSITDLKSGTHESGNVALEAAVELTNPHEFNYSPPFPPFTLVTDDEVTLRPNASFPSVGAGEKVKETLVFETDVEPDIAGLSLVVGEQGKIPEVVPFAGGAEANPYPIEPTFKGKTKALKNMGTAGFDRSTVVTALGAQIDVDLPGMRASTGSRLVGMDLRLFTTGTATTIDAEHFRLEGDGQKWAPVWDNVLAIYPADAHRDASMVFEVPNDVTELDLVITSPDDNSDRIPLEFDALPPCCGE